MNPIDRASFDAFCAALQSFPCRLAERPGSQGITFMEVRPGATSKHPQRGKVFVNTRRRNFWSVVHIGVSSPVHSSIDQKGDIEALKPLEQVVVHRFQLRYADIPIEPVIEVMEPILNSVIELAPGKVILDGKVDVYGFNKRVADAARAVLGGASGGVGVGKGKPESSRAGRRRGSVGWKPSLW